MKIPRSFKQRISISLLALLLMFPLVNQPQLATVQAQEANADNPCDSDFDLYLPNLNVELVDSNSSTASAIRENPQADEPIDGEEIASSGSITPTEPNLTTFLPFTTTLQFVVSCAELGLQSGTTAVFLNEEAWPEELVIVTPSTITVQGISQSGLQEIRISAADTEGHALYAEFRLWLGGASLRVHVEDSAHQPVNGASVTVKLADEPEYKVTGTTVNGSVDFQNIPDRTVVIEATTSNFQYASLPTLGASSEVTLTLEGIGAPSPIANNDFSLGTDGWEIGSAPVEIVSHQEVITEGIQLMADDMDLVLSTGGEGPQSVTRTFEVGASTKSVKVRYRFITTEVPGGYFGSKYNDYFSVDIRSQKGGGTISDGNSMNALGLGAFDAQGATQWRETSLPIGEDGDVIQVKITVANVGDGALPSSVIVDLVEEGQLSIEKLSLKDIDNSSLTYLSAASHTYFGGNTRVHGTITIEGSKDDELQSLELEVLQGGGVVARGTLASSVQSKLLKSFGSQEKIELTAPELLFELPSAQAAQINGTQDGTVSLRVKAKSKNGEEATKDFGAVKILVRYTDSNRYGGRDGDKGGDDWVLPSVKTIAEHFGLTYGDFSNMNGGSFPPHGSHQQGNDIDGWFDGYNARNAATASTIIGHLNDPTYGSKITTVYVAYVQVDGNAFWDAIKNVELADGRAAKSVIRPDSGHATHFHWRITP